VTAVSASCRRISALDGAGGHAADEVPLQGQEDQDGHDDGDEAGGWDEFSALSGLSLQALEGDGEHGVLAAAEEDQGDEQVVPPTEEST
jgi:hypothetical protein